MRFGELTEVCGKKRKSKTLHITCCKMCFFFFGLDFGLFKTLNLAEISKEIAVQFLVPQNCLVSNSYTSFLSFFIT